MVSQRHPPPNGVAIAVGRLEAAACASCRGRSRRLRACVSGVNTPQEALIFKRKFYVGDNVECSDVNVFQTLVQLTRCVSCKRPDLTVSSYNRLNNMGREFEFIRKLALYMKLGVQFIGLPNY